MSKTVRCTVCTGARVTPFLRIEDAPISCNHPCADRGAAMRAPTASISLGFCRDCGHILNTEYDMKRLDYRPGYENSLQGSEQFRRYDDKLVTALLERYRLRGKVIVEIGCGRGQFLRALCERGANFGFGFDPSYSDEEQESNETSQVVIWAEPFGSQNLDLNAQFVCSRHTLEHVGNPRAFLSQIRNATNRSETPVFFEIPNGLYTLRDGGIWDIIYEHCSYFTPSSLARIFLETGFEPVEVTETFSGQFLTIHAITSTFKWNTRRAAVQDLERLVETFAQRYHTELEDWKSRLRRLESAARRIVVWGAGAKATTFLNLLRPTSITYVVDVNPRKHGKYVLGTGQRIVSPEFLCDYLADDVICMNPNYLSEISDQVRALGLHARVIAA